MELSDETKRYIERDKDLAERCVFSIKNGTDNWIVTSPEYLEPFISRSEVVALSEEKGSLVHYQRILDIAAAALKGREISRKSLMDIMAPDYLMALAVDSVD